MLTPDGKHVVFGDAFGITRITLKTTSLKHSRKLSAPLRDVTLDATGKLAVTAGNHEVTLMGIPGLGVKAKLENPRGPVAFFGDRLVELRRGSLWVQTIDGKTRTDEREVSLDVTDPLPATTVGPTCEERARYTDECLSIHANGTFATYTNRSLIVGSLHLEAPAPVAFCLPLNVFDGVEISVTRNEDRTYVVVMDPAHGFARVLPVADDGTAGEIIEVQALGLPTVARQKLLYQPSNEVVVRRDLASGDEERFDVAATLEHPFEAPEDAFFAPSPRPVVTHFPGHLVDGGERFFFIPWHHETMVDVTQSISYDRELPPDSGPYRRGVLEILLRTNERLAPLQMSQRFAGVVVEEKYRTISVAVHSSFSPPTLTRAVASDYLSSWIDRYGLKTHGWNMGAAGQGVGIERCDLNPCDVDEVRHLLEWMQAFDVTLFDSTSFFDGMYRDVIGLPNDPRPDAMLFDEGAEQVFVHAMLESMRSWSPVDPARVDEWKKTPVTADETTTAIESYQGPMSGGARMLACMLVHKLGPEAFAPVVSLLSRGEQFFGTDGAVAELLVTLAFQYPDLKGRVLEAASSLDAHHQNQLEPAVSNGDRYLWSNRYH